MFLDLYFDLGDESPTLKPTKLGFDKMSEDDRIRWTPIYLSYISNLIAARKRRFSEFQPCSVSTSAESDWVTIQIVHTTIEIEQ